MGHAAADSVWVSPRRTHIEVGRVPRVAAAALVLGALAGGLAAARDASTDLPCSTAQASAGLAESVRNAVRIESTPAEHESTTLPSHSGRRPTPMKPRQAAEVLASAWHDVIGRPASRRTVAVLWAHWALETGRGARMVDYNFAGLKGRAPGGASSVVWTRESGEDGKTRVRARFRAYATAQEGARDYVRTLHARFDPAFVAANEGDARAFADALDDANYFTDHPRVYKRSIQSLASEYLQMIPR